MGSLTQVAKVMDVETNCPVQNRGKLHSPQNSLSQVVHCIGKAYLDIGCMHIVGP